MVKLFFAALETGMVGGTCKPQHHQTYARIFDIVKYGLMTFYYRESFDTDFFWQTCRPKLKLFMVDSGAYSFFSTSGLVRFSRQWNPKRSKQVEDYAPDYCKWLTIHKDQIDVYVELDIDKVFGWEKQCEIRDVFNTYNLAPLIVYHPMNKMSFSDYCQKYDYLGLGSTYLTEKTLHRYLHDAKPFGTRCHAFGYGAPKPLARMASLYPDTFYSTDTSSWNGGMKFAQLNIFTGKTIKNYRDESKLVKFGEMEPWKRLLYSATQWQLFADHLDKDI